MASDHSRLNSWVQVHTALLVEGQSRLAGLVGTDSPDWELDLATGLLTLNGCRLQFALLGSVDQQDNTWLWSWADSGLDQGAIAVARARPLRQFGEDSGLWEFTAPSFPVDGILDLGMTPGGSLAMVACPQIMGGAIFSGVYPGGRLYTVVTDPRLTLEPPAAATTARFIAGAMAYGVGDHRDIVTVYAGVRGLPVDETPTGLTLGFEDHTRLEIQFDGEGRICRMHGVVHAPPAPLPAEEPPAPPALAEPAQPPAYSQGDTPQSFPVPAAPPG